MAGGGTDPRPARSRARLLDAAATLLRAGGPSAVTVDAVIRTANVARATLYRHFPSGDDLRAAAFQSLIPPTPTPPEEGSLQERLTALVLSWAELISDAPFTLAAMSWLALGGNLDRVPGAEGDQFDGGAVDTLRERVAKLYIAPFDAIFASPQAKRELRDVDRAQAAALLLGPVMLGRISKLSGFDYRECAHSAVAGFLHVYGRQPVEPGQRSR